MLKTKKLKITVVIVAVIILVATGALYALVIRKDSKSSNNQPDNTTNLSPATQEESKQAEDNKKNNDTNQEQRQNTAPAPNTANKVTPQITGANISGGAVEVSGLIANLFENNGTCTATFTKNDTIVRKVTAVREGSSTYCPLISVPISEFKTKGTWSVVLSYQSPTSTGSSEATQFEVN